MCESNASAWRLINLRIRRYRGQQGRWIRESAEEGETVHKPLHNAHLIALLLVFR